MNIATLESAKAALKGSAPLHRQFMIKSDPNTERDVQKAREKELQLRKNLNNSIVCFLFIHHRKKRKETRKNKKKKKKEISDHIFTANSQVSKSDFG